MSLLIVNKAHLTKMNDLPLLYHKHIKKQLRLRLVVILKILIALIQDHRWVSLETLASQMPNYIKFESRRRALQRFLSLPVMKFETFWFPILKDWVEWNFERS